MENDFQHKVKQLFTIFVLALIFISSSLSLFSEEIILLLSNESYLDARRYIPLLCIPMVFYLLFPIANSGITISRETKYISLSCVLGCGINLLFLLGLINLLGVIVVPIGLGVSRIVTYWVMYKISNNKMGFCLPNYLLLILIGLVSLCFMVELASPCFGIRLVVEFFIFVFLLYYVFRQDDLAMVIIAIRKRTLRKHK